MSCRKVMSHTSFVPMPGDLVFAKVKGYPAWPARITQQINSAKFRVFFYGTFERADIKKTEIWPFNQENKDKFGPPNLKRKGYAEGLHQIENEPELAVEDGNEPTSDVTDGILADHKPLKNDEGSPIAANKGVKRSLAETDSDQGKSPVVAEVSGESAPSASTVSR